jgi:serine protease Do
MTQTRSPSPRLRVRLSVFLMALLLTACAPGTAVATTAPLPTPSPTATLPAPAEGGGQNYLTALDQSLEAIYAKVDPSVVHIRVVKMVDVQSSLGLPLMPFNTPQEPQREEGTGSGFVWDEEGYIVTNNHVIQDATEIRVTFSDGVMLPAELIGIDPDSDLAVLKVNRTQEQLHPVQVSSSSELKVGQLVAAIGNPFGLQGSMTLGVISALGRTLPADSSSREGPHYTIPAVIQTDASINPGNSGGVLVNDQGLVIGVTSAIISPNGASAGIGFAIPSDIVSRVIPHLIDNGAYEHPYIGISGRSLDADLAAAMDLPETQLGALVIEVTPNGPADKAGLQGSQRTTTIDDIEVSIGGDVITAIDGNPVKSFDDLVTYLALNTEVGDLVELKILRDGRASSVEVTLESRPLESRPLALD